MPTSAVRVASNPYPGPTPFEREQENLFFGREREVDDLYSLLTAHPVVVLSAPSGAGKTSLLNAGLIPLLSREGFEILPVARVRGYEPRGMDLSGVPNLYAFNTLLSWARTAEEATRLSSESLTSYLQRQEHPLDREGLPAPRLAIFDQFEELFTFYPERWMEREGFFGQLAEALKADRLLRVLLVIRQDYLANMDPFAPIIPNRFRTRYSLELLRRDQALSAVTEPLQGTGRTFAEGAAAGLVDKLLQIRVKSDSGKIVEVPGEFVEPVQLQILCQTMWERLPNDETAITSALLEKSVDLNEALQTFYRKAVQRTKRQTGVSQGKLRGWFESELITPAGTRGTVFRDELETGGIPNGAVDHLEEEHLIRGDVRAGARWYELTHDRFVTPIQESNRIWRESERERRIRRRAWVAIFLLLALIPLAYFAYPHVEEWRENRFTKVRVEDLEKKSEAEQRNETEYVLNQVAAYLWAKQEFKSIEKLLGILQGAQDLILRHYRSAEFSVEAPAEGIDGFTCDKLKLEEGTLTAEDELAIILGHSHRRRLNPARLRVRWMRHTQGLASQWGIPFPAELKSCIDRNLPIDTLLFRISSTTGGVKKEIRRSMPFLFGSVQDVILVRNTGDNPLVKRLLVEGKRGWTRLAVQEPLGQYWIVPHWTLPLWKVSGCDAYPLEEAAALALESRLLGEPDLMLSPGALQWLLDRHVSEGHQRQTVQEAIAARGSIEDIRQVFLELLYWWNQPITPLIPLLDLLAKYPASHFSVKEAAQHVFNEVRGSGESSALNGPHPYPAVEYPPGEHRAMPYDHCAQWLDLPPRIRVLLGKDLEDAFRNRETGLLHPEVFEALAEVRGDAYRNFGLMLPEVQFRDAGADMKPNEFQIVLLNESPKDPTKRIVPSSPDLALPQVIAALHSRLDRNRSRFVTAEDVEGWLAQVPGELRGWLMERYSLTDLKLIFRAVVAPTQAELDCFGTAPEHCMAREKRMPDQTLRHPSWLLGALVFWTNAAGAMDLEGIAQGLRDTQGARLGPSAVDLPGDEVAALMRDGLAALGRNDTGHAATCFSEALQMDRNGACNAFRILYALDNAVTFDGQALELLNSNGIGKPAGMDSKHTPDIRTRCEIEDTLETGGSRLTEDQRRTLGLALYSKYKAEGLLTKSAHLLKKLRQEYDRRPWPAREEYALAYWLLSEHGNKMTQPSDLPWIHRLLSSAFGKFEEGPAEDAFDKLLADFYLDRRLPGWFCSLLGSLADSHSRSFRIPYYLGAALADQPEASMAVGMLDRAQQNISRLPGSRREPWRAWVDLYRATAYITLGTMEPPEKRLPSSQSATLILKDLKKLRLSVPAHDTDYPGLGDIYRAMAEACLIVNDVGGASAVIDEGFPLFPDHVPLLREKLFVHLSRQETGKAFDLIRDAQSGSIANNPDVRFLAAMLQLLASEGDWEYAARSFLATNHDYTDYIRMMLHCNLLRQEKNAEAQELLRDRWRTVDRPSWDDRLDQGDESVLRERLIGYYLNEVSKEDLFRVLEDDRSFRNSPFSHIARSPVSMLCEAHFYDALLQGSTGDPATRTARQTEALQRVVETHSYIQHEYQMARFLLGRLHGTSTQH